MSLPALSLTPSAPQGSAAGRFVRRAAGIVVAVVRAIVHRREVTDLLHLDDRQLKDVGLVRGDVLGALAGPLSADPSIILRLRSVDHRARVRQAMIAAEASKTRRLAAKLRDRADAQA